MISKRLAVAVVGGALIGVAMEFVVRPYITNPIENKVKEVVE